MFGSLKARMGRLLGKIPKKGILLTLNATQKEDSLFGNTKLPIFGELEFKGILSEDKISGKFIQNDTIKIGTLAGKITTENSIDYSPLFPQIVDITQQNIYNKQELETKSWKKTKSKLENLLKNAEDDMKLFLGFNMISPKLLFSHYNLFIGSLEKEKDETQKTITQDETTEEENVEPTVIFQEKSKNTAYLKTKNFSSSTNELAEIFPTIVAADYQNLIIDLRDNGGDGIEAAFEFAKHIVKKDVTVGYFVTNKLTFSGFQKNLFEKLPEAQPKSTTEFTNNLKTSKGSKLVFKKHSNKIFSGNLYILTNSNTGSTCEPIVYILKKEKWATIIGETTAGKMLFASPFRISGKYLLSLPIADFYTSDGFRIEGKGVQPQIETESENALKKGMDIINLR